MQLTMLWFSVFGLVRKHTVHACVEFMRVQIDCETT